MTRHELEKMTVTKLREEALKFPELTGVHGMQKSELVDLLAKLLNLPEEEAKPKKKKVKHPVSKGKLKKIIKSLKEERAEALQTKDKKRLKAIRKRIKKAKRTLRALAA